MLLDSKAPAALSSWLPEAAIYGLAGLAVTFAGKLLTGTENIFWILAVSIVRLWLAALAGSAAVCVLRGKDFAAPDRRLLAAAAYPVDLAGFAFRTRAAWLPQLLLDYSYNATAYLIFLSGFLLLSILITMRVLQEISPDRIHPALRTWTGVLFLLTSVGVTLVPAPSAGAFFRNLAEPAALAGYTALLGFSQAVREHNKLS